MSAGPDRPGDENAPVYVDVVAWGSPAETWKDNLAQGRRDAVSGRLEYSESNLLNAAEARAAGPR